MPKKGERKYTADQLEKLANEYIKECKESGKVPFLVGLANKLEIDQSRLYDWEKVNPSYALSIKKVRQMSEQMLIDKAINENKPVFPIFLLKSKFGYQEAAQKIDLSTTIQGVIQLPEKGSARHKE